jgi:DNA replication protein DnaC
MVLRRVPAASLGREVASRQTHGGENASRRRTFHRPRHSRTSTSPISAVRKEIVPHLGTLDFIEAKDNVIFLGPPGTGKSHLAIALGARACQAGHRVAFATAADWVDRLGEAHAQARLHDELIKLGRIPLLVIDEVGYVPFEAEAANPVVPARPLAMSARV